jgi:capsular polysaccharide biosynthesis protein
LEDLFAALIEKVRERLGIEALLTRVSGAEEINRAQDTAILDLCKSKMDAEKTLELLEKLAKAFEQQIAETEARLNRRIDQVLEDEQHRVHDMLVEGLGKV